MLAMPPTQKVSNMLDQDSPSVLAIAAHPDDIEFVMAGTLLRLIELGWEAHYFNIANGCCGSSTLTPQECAATRLEEAKSAAEMLPAKFYSPIRNDLEVFYDHETHVAVADVVRRARPSIILTHSASDYMEDHQNAARLAVGAAFVRAVPNFPSAETTYDTPVAIYHAQPHGNRDPMGQLVTPTHFVDTSELAERKRELLNCHRSQAKWLDETQGMNSYLDTMSALNREVGTMSNCFEQAEGWRKHIHFGLSEADFDPMRSVLADKILFR